jgi:hypothetical protein
MATDQEAGQHGISPRAEVRQGLIDFRANALSAGAMQHAVLLSHAIWWLTTDQEATVVKEGHCSNCKAPATLNDRGRWSHVNGTCIAPTEQHFVEGPA